MYGSRLILRENIRWRRYTAHQWLRNNKLGIHFIWQQFMLSENPGGESTTIRQKVRKLTHNAVSRCPAAEHDFQTTVLRFGSPIISQIWVYLREIVDLYKGIFARIAKKLSTTVLNLIVVSISLTAIFSNVGIRLGNYLRVCSPGFPVEVSKHSMMSGSLIISLFRVYLRETVELYSNIFVSILKKLSITVLEFHANLGIIRIENYCPAVDLIISQF